MARVACPSNFDHFSIRPTLINAADDPAIKNELRTIRNFLKLKGLCQVRDKARRIPGRRGPLTASSVDEAIAPLLANTELTPVNPNTRGTTGLRR